MRHLWSLLAGVVAAPLTWLFLATGQHRAQAVVERWDTAARFDTADLIGPAVFLAVAGILLGLIGTLRWSPAGPVAAGVLLTAPTVLMFINPFRTLEGFFRPADEAPQRFLGQDLEPWLPVENGTLLVLGSLLLMAVFSVQRWRRWAATATPLPAATDDEVVAGISALGGSSGTRSSEGAGEGEGSEGAVSGDQQPAQTRPTMTDEEILAAAAAYESSASTPTAGRPPDEEDGNRSSGPAGGGNA